MRAPSEPAMGIYELLTMEPDELVFVAMEYARRLSSERLTPAAAAQEMSPSEMMLAIAPEMLLLASENQVGNLSGFVRSMPVQSMMSGGLMMASDGVQEQVENHEGYDARPF